MAESRRQLDELGRLAALHRYVVLNDQPDPVLDDLAALVARICHASVAVIGFLDAERHWAKAAIGLSVRSVARDDAVCSYTVLQEEPLVVPDLTQDPRFAESPLVTSELKLHSYAGVSVVTPDGYAIGTICVMDREQLDLDPDQLASLQAISRQVMDHLELQHTVAELAAVAAERERMADELRENEERYRRLFIRAQRQAQEQLLLERVRTALAHETNLQDLLRTIVEAVAATFGYTQVSLYLRQGDKSVLQHQVGYDHVITEVPMGEGVVSRVLLTGQPILIKDAQSDPDFLGAIDNIASEVCVPLFDRGVAAGILNVESVNGVRLTEADLGLLVAVADHASVALARTRLYAEAQRQAQELALLDRVRSSLAQQLELPGVYRASVEAVAATFGYTQVSFYVLVHDKLILQHQVGYENPFVEIDLMQGVIGHVAATGKPVLVGDVSTDPRYRAAYDNITSEVCVPVKDRDRVTSVLNIESVQGVTLTEADLALMVALSDQIGVAIGRARLYQETQRRNQLLTALHETALDLLNRLELGDLLSAIVGRAAQLENTNHGYIYLLDPDLQEMEIKVAIGRSAPHKGRRLKLGEGLAGRVWQTGQPLAVDDYAAWLGHLSVFLEEETFAAAAVPLRSGSQIIGILGMSYVTPGRTFGEEEVEVLTRFAQLASVAIDNALLYSSSQQELQERRRIETALNRHNQYLAALYDMTLGLMNRLDVSGLLETMITRATQLVDTPDGYIYLLDESGETLELKWGIGAHAPYVGVRLKAGEGLAGRIWQMGQTVAIEDYKNWPYRSDAFPGTPVRAIAGFPLKSEGRITGVLGISFTDPARFFTPDEIESLERFAQLASLALDNARLYTTAQHELDERNRTEQALASANVELEQALLNAKELAIASQSANRAKSEFLANMSHELRTPLSAVMGYSELLHATVTGVEQKEYLEQIRVSSEALLGIISDVLDFSKIEAGHMALERAEFNLVEISRQALYTMMPNAVIKKLRLTSEVAPDVPRFVVSDAARLRQILLNLLSNAVKFTERGQVVLKISNFESLPDKYVLEFAIQDTGPGIPADKLTMIFDPFTQVDGSVTRRHGGTGLGLAIARQLVDMFGGEIWVESEIGQGSTFHFTAMFDQPDGLDKQALPGTESASYSGVQEPSAHHLKILLAEDNVVNQRVLARMLEKLGWMVTVVSDGQEAITESGENVYDVILMDVQMPEMDGLTATMAIRSRERQIGGHIPIVALTAYAMQGDRERCLMAGMDDYLSKPVRVEDLQRIVERFVQINRVGY